MNNWKGIVGQSFSVDAFRQYVDTISFDTWRPQFVVLHNTGAPTLADWHRVPGAIRMRNLESFYRDAQHWSAGPHLFIADDAIWVFTPLNVPGVHSPSWNSISWGVEMVGDYATEVFGAAVHDNAVNALAVLHAALGLDPTTLKLHKEDKLTTHDCPGRNVVKNEIIQGVTAAMVLLHPGDHAPEAAASIPASAPAAASAASAAVMGASAAAGAAAISTAAP